MFITAMPFFLMKLPFPSILFIATIFYVCIGSSLKVAEQIVESTIVFKVNFKVLKN